MILGCTLFNNLITQYLNTPKFHFFYILYLINSYQLNNSIAGVFGQLYILGENMKRNGCISKEKNDRALLVD